MATCAHCKTQQTELYENGVPVCILCADARDARIKEGFRRWPAVTGSAEKEHLVETNWP